MYQMTVKNIISELSKEELERQVNQKFSNILLAQSQKTTQQLPNDI